MRYNMIKFSCSSCGAPVSYQLEPYQRKRTLCTTCEIEKRRAASEKCKKDPVKAKKYKERQKQSQKEKPAKRTPPYIYRDILEDSGFEIMNDSGTVLNYKEKISAIVHYVECKNMRKTSEHFGVSYLTMKSLINRYPRILKHFEEKAKKTVISVLDSVQKGAMMELDRRLKETPEKFSNIELNLVAGTAFDKKRIEEGKPEKIIKFDSAQTMQNMLEKINEEIQNAKIKPLTIVDGDGKQPEDKMESETAS